MKVFNTCFIIIRRHVGAFLIYFVIFIALSVIMTAFATDQYNMDFSTVKPNFTVINRDENTALTQGLTEYLRLNGTEKKLSDNQEEIQDALFYHASDYILIISNGFHEAFEQNGEILLDVVITPDSAKGYYMDGLVNQYLNMYQAYRNMSDNGEEIIAANVSKALLQETKVEKKQFGISQPVNENYEIYNRMECYIIMVLITLCVSTVLLMFRRPDLNMRNLCSPIKPRWMNGQLTLCSAVISFIVWLLMTLTGFIIYGAKLVGTDMRIILLLLLNSFVLTIVALALAMLAGSFVRSMNSQHAVSNFLSLGLCFLGGVFVPLEMMGEGILSVARLTPTYWYSSALKQICDLTSFGNKELAPIWQAMLIQIGYAVAIFCVSAVINKYRNQSEKSFSSIQTEIEK